MMLRCKVGLPEAFWEFCLFFTPDIFKGFTHLLSYSRCWARNSSFSDDKKTQKPTFQHYAKTHRFTHQTGVTNSSYFNQTKLSVSTIKHNRHLSRRKRWNDKKKKQRKKKKHHNGAKSKHEISSVCAFTSLSAQLFLDD